MMRTNNRLQTSSILELVSQAQGGDPTSWLALCDVFEPLLRAAAARYARSPTLREDIRGEAYIILFRLVSSFDSSNGVSIFTYLQRTLHPSVYSYVRQRQIECTREISLDGMRKTAVCDYEGDTSVCDVIVPSREVRPNDRSVEAAVLGSLHLQSLIETLPASQQDIVLLRLDGFSFDEIAIILGISGAACRQRFQRARRSLRPSMEKSELAQRH